MRIELGAKVRDKITGFVGIATGRASFITGCDQYIVTPPVDDKGAYVEGRWIDVGRLEVIEDSVVKTETVAGPAPG